MLIINDKYRINVISMADMLTFLLSKRSQDDTSPFTRDTLANFEIARISSMQNIIFVIHCPKVCACLLKDVVAVYEPS